MKFKTQILDGLLEVDRGIRSDTEVGTKQIIPHGCWRGETLEVSANSGRFMCTTSNSLIMINEY